MGVSPSNKILKTFLHPINNITFVDVQNPNLEYDADKALQAAVDLDYKENEKLSPYQKEFLKCH